MNWELTDSIIMGIGGILITILGWVYKGCQIADRSQQEFRLQCHEFLNPTKAFVGYPCTCSCDVLEHEQQDPGACLNCSDCHAFTPMEISDISDWDHRFKRETGITVKEAECRQERCECMSHPDVYMTQPELTGPVQYKDEPKWCGRCAKVRHREGLGHVHCICPSPPPVDYDHINSEINLLTKKYKEAMWKNT